MCNHTSGTAPHPPAAAGNGRRGKADKAGRAAMGWRAILIRTGRRIGQDNLPGLAAGIAFYALLSLFPALTAAVSLYGLVADPSTVERQVTALTGLLPPEAVTLIAAWLRTLVQGPPTRFGIGLSVSLLLAFWSAWSATGMLMTAVNTCYGVEETRRFVRFNFDAVALTTGLALFGFAALALLAVLPVSLDLLPVSSTTGETIALVRWPLLVGLVMLALVIVYRYAPDRVQPTWEWVSWGAVAATALWLAGSHGAVIILLLWLYWTAYVVLVGAEINAELERQAGGPALPR
jgi:membrane protein